MISMEQILSNAKIFPTVEIIEKRKKLFNSGDTVKVYTKIKEGENERIQIFTGLVLKKRGGSLNATFTVRKISYGIGVERTFLLGSPMIDKIEVIKRGKVRRAKLYYLRDKKGKSAQVKEQI